MSQTEKTEDEEAYHQEVLSHQQIMISALKQEIVRLQEQIAIVERQRNVCAQLYKKSQSQVETLKDKLAKARQNNQSLIQTLEIFQRQFIKRDYNSIITQLKEKQTSQEVPPFMQFLNNMKTKFKTTTFDTANVPERSQLSEYYGFFFHSEMDEPEVELYREVRSEKRIRISKIKTFGKKHFFNQKFRHIFWFNSIENVEKITYKLYEILTETRNQQSKLPCKEIIEMDLRRMDFKIDDEKKTHIKQEIKKCLELFQLYRPDIGYVQGMSYFAWMILIRMKSYQAFVCFSNIILHDPFINSLYMFKRQKINSIISFYLECLEDKKPKLSKHMIKLEVEPQLFLIEWAYTFFSRAFNLRIVSKIWDLWFSEGFNIFFKVVMAIMEMFENELLEQKQNDRIIEIVRGSTQKVSEPQFFRYLNRQKLFEDLKIANDNSK